MKTIVRYIAILLVCCATYPTRAQRIATVSGEYRYVVPQDIPINRATQIAIDKARNEAIANEFGRVVIQSTNTAIHTADGQSRVQTDSHASTESKAIWLSDTQEPQVNMSYENGALVITATVYGKARELKMAAAELKMRILRNGIETEQFKHKDKVAIGFKSPVNGHVAIFIRDDAIDSVYCMLPYAHENGIARAIKRNDEYTFLSRQDPNYRYRFETTFTAKQAVEFNTVILVFSRNPFTMPASEKGEWFNELSAEDFQRWLRKNRISDETMQTIEKTVQINK